MILTNRSLWKITKRTSLHTFQDTLIPFLRLHFVKRFCLLIILEGTHPPRPVFRLGAAADGPAIGSIEVTVPLQRPKLFETGFSGGAVQKSYVDESIVPVDTKTPDRIRATAGERGFVILGGWRSVSVFHPGAPPPAI